MANLPEYRVYLEKKPEGFDTLAASLNKKIRYDEAGKKLILTGRLTDAEKKELRELFPLDEAYQDALEHLLWKSESLQFSIPLEKPPEGWASLSDSLRNKIFYDGKKLLLIGYLMENERKELLGLSKDADYQEAIEFLFWKSKSPPDKLERKERDDKDFVTERLSRMNPWVHCLLAAWLIIIGIGSIVVLIGIWPNLKNSSSLVLTPLQDGIALDFRQGEFKPPFTIETLCQAIDDDNYGIPLQKPKSSIGRLNELLEVPDFYTAVRTKKPDSNFSEKVTQLEKETEEYRKKPFSELQNDEKYHIKSLNRLLLQEVYPDQTPVIPYKSQLQKWFYGIGDQVMFILAFLAGIIGSATHGISSLMDFRGNRRLFRSWSLWYFGLPILGGMVAIIFYITVRAGFITGNNGTENINPFGIAAVSVMVGLFTDKATSKLAEVFDTMFKTTTKKRDGDLDTSRDKEKAES